jgi:hypothetical protein
MTEDKALIPNWMGKKLLIPTCFVCNKKEHRSYQYKKKEKVKNEAEQKKGEKKDETKQKAGKATVLLAALSSAAVDSEWIISSRDRSHMSVRKDWIEDLNYRRQEGTFAHNDKVLSRF